MTVFRKNQGSKALNVPKTTNVPEYGALGLGVVNSWPAGALSKPSAAAVHTRRWPEWETFTLTHPTHPEETRRPRLEIGSRGPDTLVLRYSINERSRHGLLS